MPQVGRVEISIIEEDQSRLLAFQNGELDIMNLEGPLAPKVLDGDKLRPEFARKGVQLSRIIDPEISYLYWNLQDPVVGGLSKDKIALRRAMAMAYPVDEDIKVARNGQAVEANYPIPPGVVGHQPQWRPSIRYDPAGANALLDKFGYKKGADGFRTLPDGKPLVVRHSSRPDTAARQLDELVKKSMDAIGVRVEFHKDKFPELLKLEKQCKLQSRIASWIADYPDGDNFMQLLYGPNTFQSNNACAKIPEYDKLYEQSQRDAAGPGARQALPGHDAHHRGVRAVAAAGEPLSQPARAAAGAGLSQAPDPARALAVSGRGDADAVTDGTVAGFSRRRVAAGAGTASAARGENKGAVRRTRAGPRCRDPIS